MERLSEVPRCYGLRDAPFYSFDVRGHQPAPARNLVKHHLVELARREAKLDHLAEGSGTQIVGRDPSGPERSTITSASLIPSRDSTVIGLPSIMVRRAIIAKVYLY